MVPAVKWGVDMINGTCLCYGKENIIKTTSIFTDVVKQINNQDIKFTSHIWWNKKFHLYRRIFDSPCIVSKETNISNISLHDYKICICNNSLNSILNPMMVEGCLCANN